MELGEKTVRFLAGCDSFGNGKVKKCADEKTWQEMRCGEYGDF